MITSFLYDTKYIPSAPVAKIMVSYQREVELTALIDSGADATMIPIDLLRKIKARVVETRRLRGISGGAEIVQLYGVTIRVQDHVLPSVHVVATAHGGEPILGRDVLNHLIVTLNGLAGVTEIAV
jgi:predicted aspartyl protease